MVHGLVWTSRAGDLSQHEFASAQILVPADAFRASRDIKARVARFAPSGRPSRIPFAKGPTSPRLAMGVADCETRPILPRQNPGSIDRHARVAFDDRVMHLDGATHRIDHGTKLDESAVHRTLYDARLVDRDRRVDQSLRNARSRASVRSSSTSVCRPSPTTSAAKIAVRVYDIRSLCLGFK